MALTGSPVKNGVAGESMTGQLEHYSDGSGLSNGAVQFYA